ADGADREPAWRLHRMGRAVSDRARGGDVAHLHDSRTQRHDGLDRTRAIGERVTAVEADAGAHEIAAMLRIEEYSSGRADRRRRGRKLSAQALEEIELRRV